MGDAGRVMITCPTTGRPLPTGMVMSVDAFVASALSTNPVICPHCAKPHTWSKSDAWVDIPQETA